MGSTGSDRFSDFPRRARGAGIGLGTGNGDAPDGDAPDGDAPDGDELYIDAQCSGPFSAQLEDIEHSTYYQSNNTLPPVDLRISIRQAERIVAVDPTGASIGNIPISLNHLADCLDRGINYTGTVTISRSNDPAVVMVSFEAEE